MSKKRVLAFRLLFCYIIVSHPYLFWDPFFCHPYLTLGQHQFCILISKHWLVLFPWYWGWDCKRGAAKVVSFSKTSESHFILFFLTGIDSDIYSPEAELVFVLFCFVWPVNRLDVPHELQASPWQEALREKPGMKHIKKKAKREISTWQPPSLSLFSPRNLFISPKMP